jgi:hypothetical protein
MTDLPALGGDPRHWTLAEAAAFLGKPTENPERVRLMVELFEIPASGRKKTGPRTRGRWPTAYPAAKLLKAHDAVTRYNEVL